MPLKDDHYERTLAEAVWATHEVEAQFFQGGAVSVLLFEAKRAAVKAAAALVDVDPADAGRIKHYQSEVNRYRDLAVWITQTVEVGMEAQADMSEKDREAAAEAVRDYLGVDMQRFRDA